MTGGRGRKFKYQNPKSKIQGKFKNQPSSAWKGQSTLYGRSGVSAERRHFPRRRRREIFAEAAPKNNSPLRQERHILRAITEMAEGLCLVKR
jgi:hypothetical protein